MTARLVSTRGLSPRLAWARVGADGFEPLAAAAGLTAIVVDAADERWFGRAAGP